MVVNLDPHGTREATVTSTCRRSASTGSDGFVVHDQMTGQAWNWGENNFVRLGSETPAHNFAVALVG